MPPCGTPFDENLVPPWTRAEFRGVLNRRTNPPWRWVEGFSSPICVPQSSSRLDSAISWT